MPKPRHADIDALAKAARAFQAEAKDFEVARLAVLKKYGKPEGDQYRIDDPHNLSDANAELALVLSREISVPVDRIRVPESGTISARDLLLLEPLLEP